MPSGAPISATARYVQARLRSGACVTTPAQSLILSCVRVVSACLYLPGFLIFLTLLSSLAIAILRMYLRSLVRSCTIIRRKFFSLIFALPPSPTVSEVHTQRSKKRNKSREKEKKSGEGVEKREKRQRERERERRKEKVSGAIIWYPWLVSRSPSRRQRRLCWIYL